MKRRLAYSESYGRRRSSRRHGQVRIMGALLLAMIVALAAGFARFVQVVHQPEPPVPPHADGVVALTGGAGRVELALHLLESGRADKLLISGIGGRTDLATLGRRAGVQTDPLADRITLGRYAASTRGNGVETAAWAQQNDVHTLIVVTSAYHMPRAILSLRLALPDVQLLPLAVKLRSPNDDVADSAQALKLEALEYVKYLLTITGLSEWFPKREVGTLTGQRRIA